MASRSLNTQFCADPATFLRAHSVRWAGGGPADQKNITVVMMDDQARKARYRTSLLKVKKDAAALKWMWTENPVDQPPVGLDSFDVIWSGYKAGAVRHARLPAGMDGPNIMLTPEFSGCTAACRTNADGTAEFSHYNMKTEDDKSTLPDDEVIAHAANHYGGGQSTLTKTDYRGKAVHLSDPAKPELGGIVNATIVGFRRSGNWEFWVQYNESKFDPALVTVIEAGKKRKKPIGVRWHIRGVEKLRN